MATLTRQGISAPYVESLTDDPADVWDHIQPIIRATAQTEIRRGDFVTLDTPSMIDAAREHPPEPHCEREDGGFTAEVND